MAGQTPYIAALFVAPKRKMQKGLAVSGKNTKFAQ
jgi:hypothetical protein